jgi:hypothetical protein
MLVDRQRKPDEALTKILISIHEAFSF